MQEILPMFPITLIKVNQFYFHKILSNTLFRTKGVLCMHEHDLLLHEITGTSPNKSTFLSFPPLF